MQDEFKKGASASLNKTISEIMEYMEDDGGRSSSSLRKQVREKVADIAYWWFQEGFYLGHRQSYRALRDDEEIPSTLTFEYRDANLAPEVWRDVDLESRIRRT